jgi:DNA-binding transcriptional MerR regulator
MSELHLRGFDQGKVDSALRCLVHVYAVQDSASTETGGILAEDIVSTYPLDVVQAATQIFLDTSMTRGREVFRVKWGCESAALTMEERLWDHASQRWEEFVGQLDGRYLGFFLPGDDDTGRVTSNWKLNNELKWFSVQVPRQGWKILAMMDDVTEVAWKLDLAFGFRPFEAEGIQAERVLLHKRAYELLKSKTVAPAAGLVRSIRLWRFFSEYDVHATDFVALMRESGLTLEEVKDQVEKFFAMGLTSTYREGQYPPYFINDKRKKEFQQAVTDLLTPMDEWLSRGGGETRLAKQTAQPTQPDTSTAE